MKEREWVHALFILKIIKNFLLKRITFLIFSD